MGLSGRTRGVKSDLDVRSRNACFNPMNGHQLEQLRPKSAASRRHWPDRAWGVRLRWIRGLAGILGACSTKCMSRKQNPFRAGDEARTITLKILVFVPGGHSDVGLWGRVRGYIV